MDPFLGTARYFAVYDNESLQLGFLENVDIRHPQGSCQPVEALKACGCDAVVCRKLADLALRRLEDAGIKAFQVDATTVGEAIRRYHNVEAAHFGGGSPGAHPASCQGIARCVPPSGRNGR
ncbi:MAG: NifB/NifX family molybdenum-iron cluster-binding protein [Spirochaetes bacterium]|nr:NifB/NifX family molybdenum-iron cluster-binding protein [Spirochaetota bacterium]